jgi:hypothetical protein
MSGLFSRYDDRPCGFWGRAVMSLPVIMLVAALCFMLSVPLFAQADGEKGGEVCGEGVAIQWWPTLEPVKGWHHEREASEIYGINIQVPDGSTFSDAETVIYAKALYKPRIPETTSLETLITDDRKRYLIRDPDTRITEVKPVKAKGGETLRTYVFFPEKKGNWELVSYAEEKDFYLLFVISSRSREGLTKAFPAYEQYVGQYKIGR